MALKATFRRAGCLRCLQGWKRLQPPSSSGASSICHQWHSTISGIAALEWHCIAPLLGNSIAKQCFFGVALHCIASPLLMPFIGIASHCFWGCHQVALDCLSA
eukprot:1475118-Amphidinium_carterae.4